MNNTTFLWLKLAMAPNFGWRLAQKIKAIIPLEELFTLPIRELQHYFHRRHFCRLVYWSPMLIQLVRTAMIHQVGVIDHWSRKDSSQDKNLDTQESFLKKGSTLICDVKAGGKLEQQ